LTTKLSQVTTPQNASTPTPGDELVSLKDVARTLSKRIWLIVLVIVLVEGLAVGYSFLVTPQYEASIKVLVGQRNIKNPTFARSVLDLQQLTLTMARAVDSRPIAKAAIQRLDLPTTPGSVVANLESEAIEETQFIEVTYTDSDPQRAQQVVNAVGEAFSERVSEISLSTNAVTATVWEPAVTPNDPVSPNPARNILLGLVLGLMLGVGLAFLLEYLDDTWHSAEEAELLSGVPTLGAIPEVKVSNNDRKGGY
jgi:capsular polysaccharide biosynthesis protein